MDEGGKDCMFGINRQIIIIYRMDKQGLYSTWNYIQYPVLNHNRKGYEKECVYN